MLAPLSWIKEYIDTKSTAEKIAEELLLSGTKVEETIKIGQELVFNLEITPNRPDTLSMLGIAREIAAIEQKDFKLPDTELLLPQKPVGSKVNFEVRSKKLCQNYSIVRLTDLKIGNSPTWLKNFLSLANVRSLNNIVDITNFVMLELGQPMHAFDASKIKGKMILRGAKPGEVVTTLDGQDRKLSEGAIIIEDEEKIIDLAGLMGGQNSDIDNKTSDIILLVPVYDPVTIRKTSIYTNLRTEASNRFEKKLDPNLHSFAILRAIKLFSELAEAKTASAVFSTPEVPARKLQFPKSLIANVIGIDLSDETLTDLLSAAGFILRPSKIREDELEIQIPSYRTDIEISEDILEEISRLYGYNKIPKTLPSGEYPQKQELFKKDSESRLRNFLLRNGFTETTGFTLISKKDCLNFGYSQEHCLKVKNPASSDFEFLRPILLINSIKAISANPEETTLSFFEIAKTFSKAKDKDTGLPKQTETLSLITTKSLTEFKGILSELWHFFRLKLDENQDNQSSIFKNKLDLFQNNQKIGTYGEISPEVLKLYDIKNKTALALEVNLDIFQEPEESVYENLPKYPAVKEDVSFFLEDKFLIGEVVSSLKGIKFVDKVFLSDVFENPQGRSVTLSLSFLNPEQTMQQQEIAQVREKVFKLLETKFEAKIRRD